MPSKKPARTATDTDLDRFAADALDWIAENSLWGRFMVEMVSRGFTEDECEAMSEAVSKRAGR